MWWNFNQWNVGRGDVHHLQTQLIKPTQLQSSSSFPSYQRNGEDSVDVEEVEIQRPKKPGFLNYNWDILYQIPKSFMSEK